MEIKKREFIDPNDLMEYINKNYCYSGLPMAAHICTMELLTYAPRVDAVEVKHGRWVNGYPISCSVCGGFAPTDYEDCNRYEAWLTTYCPNCGAKMDLK